MKALYGKNLLFELLGAEDAENVVESLRKLTLKHVAELIADAWNDITPQNIRNAWRKLRPALNDTDGNDYNFIDHSNAGNITNNSMTDAETSVSEVVQALRMIPGCEKCDTDDVQAWLNIDSDDEGWEVLNDNGIVLNIAHEVS